MYPRLSRNHALNSSETYLKRSSERVGPIKSVRFYEYVQCSVVQQTAVPTDYRLFAVPETCTDLLAFCEYFTNNTCLLYLSLMIDKYSRLSRIIV